MGGNVANLGKKAHTLPIAFEKSHEIARYLLKLLEIGAENCKKLETNQYKKVYTPLFLQGCT